MHECIQIQTKATHAATHCFSIGVWDHITKMITVGKVLTAGGIQLDIIVGYIQAFPKSPKLSLRTQY